MTSIRIHLTLAIAGVFVGSSLAQTNAFPANGNAGIGTTAPAVPLHVFKSAGDELVRLEAAAPYIYFKEGDETSPAGRWRIVADDGSLRFDRSTNGDFASYAPDFVINRLGRVGIGTWNPVSALSIEGQLSGGFGAHSTGGVLNWNDVSNTRSGNGYSLLLGTAANGPGPDAYFHPFNFEYSTKDGTGSITQLAVPYSNGSAIDQGIWMRGRYWSDPWGPWVRIISENTQGNVGIGTTAPTHKLAVNGTIRAKEVIVDTGWADHVFAADYRLAPLSEVEQHIQQRGHLPDVPSAADVAERGVSVGEMQKILLQKIEELTLHAIEQRKLLESQQVEIARLRAQVSQISSL